MRPAKDGAHFRKWPGQNESIPALHPPAARILHVDRYHLGARLLRQENDALTELVGRSARAVWCNDDVFAVLNHFSELPNCARALPRTRAPHDLEIETLDQIRQQ